MRKSGEERVFPLAETVDAAMLCELAQRFDLLLVGAKPKTPLLREVGETPHRIADLGGKTDVLTLAALCESSRGVFGVGNGVLQLGKFYEKPIAAPHEGGIVHALQTFGF